MTRRTAIGAALTILFVLLGAARADAHAVLQATSPADRAHLDAAPSSVSLTFSESVSASLGAVKVFDGTGTRVDNGDVVVRDKTVTLGLKSGLGEGAYVVTWRVISADSHPVKGAFTFIVGQGADASTQLVQSLFSASGDRGLDAAGAVGRGLAYGGVLLAAGGALFLTLIHDGGRDGRRLRAIVLISAAIGAIGVVVALPIEAALATGLGLTSITRTGVLPDVLSHGVGISTALAVGGLVILSLGLTAVPTSLRRSVTIAGATLASVSFAFAGHTTTTSPWVLVDVADGVHLLAGAAWFGGLVFLFLTLLRRGGDRDPIVLGGIVRRFTLLATVCVVAVTVAGLTLGWAEVRALRALTSTTYGKLLLIKAGVVVPVVVVAAYNHFRLVPALHTAAAKGRDAWRHLNRTVRIESVGLVIVLGLTSVLVNTVPASTAAGIGTIFSRTEALGDNSVNLVVDPNRVGANSIHLYLLDSTGRPAELAQTVELDLSLPSSNIGPIARQPFVAGPGHYQLNSDDLSIAGTWTIVVRAQVSKFEEKTATFTVTVNP